MNKRLLMMSILLALVVGRAQDSYVGGGLTFLTDLRTTLPVAAFQAGGWPETALGVPGALDTILFVTLLGGDVFYAFPLPDSNAEVYVGGGPDLLLVLIPIAAGSTLFGVHGTAGIEYRFDRLGLYGEVRPAYINGLGTLLHLRTGINFHF